MLANVANHTYLPFVK